MRNPIAGLPFQFFGYMYAAFNNFTVPLVQNPSANKLLGVGMMIGLSSLVEPMRAWGRGEEFEADDPKALDQWFMQGYIDSGVGGYPIEFIEMLDSILNIPFLDRYRHDKFARREWTGILGGPFGSYGTKVAQVLRMFADGKFNEKDVMAIKNLLPIPIPLTIFGNKLVTEGIKGFFDLPETREDADYYSWVDR
jgi:hypothetical protein